MRINLSVMLLAALLAVPALAGVGVSSYCDGGTVQITVTIFNDEFPAAWAGFVVERSTLGLCDSGTIITATPLPVPEQLYTVVFHPLSEPVPAPNIYYVYKVWAVDAQGALIQPYGMGTPGLVDFAACGEALVTRGNLVVSSYEYHDMGIIECLDTCWDVCPGGLIPVTEEQFDALLPYATSGTPVDLYGELRYDGMPGSFCFQSILRFEPSPGGICGPIPVVGTTWGGLKARYR